MALQIKEIQEGMSGKRVRQILNENMQAAVDEAAARAGEAVKEVEGKVGDLALKVDNNTRSIGDLKPMLVEKTTTYHYDDFTWANGQLRGDNGAIVSGTSPKVCDNIIVEGCKTLSFVGAIHTTSAVHGYAFFDNNHNYISGSKYNTDTSLSEREPKVYDLTIPSNAKFFGCTIYDQTKDGWYISITKISKENTISIADALGDFDLLKTEDKSSVVNAINSLYGKTTDVEKTISDTNKEIVKNKQSIETIEDEIKYEKVEDLSSTLQRGGYYVNTNKAVGEVVDISNLSSSSYWGYAIIQTKENDKFRVKGFGGGNPRLWAFTNKNYALQSKDNANNHTADYIEIQAPCDGYLICNSQYSQSNYPFGLLRVGKISIRSIIDELLEGKDNEGGNEKSVFYRNVNYGVIATKWYESKMQQFADFNRQTNYTTISAAFDSLAANSNGYITTEILGMSVNNQVIKAYTLRLPKYDLEGTIEKPKIVIISGQQGFEKCDVYGLYYLFKDLSENYIGDETLNYLRSSVEIRCIPIVNPDGWDTLSYCNANSVSLNRNYATKNWKYVYSETDISQNSGDAPFSEPETRIVRDYFNQHLDAVLAIDYHTNGQYSISDIKKINWIATNSQDGSDTTNRLINCAIQHLSRVSLHFNSEFNLGLSATDICGYVSATETSPGVAKTWFKEQGVLATTFEGFNGFPNRTMYNGEPQKACAELIGNFVAEVLYYLSQ